MLRQKLEVSSAFSFSFDFRRSAFQHFAFSFSAFQLHLAFQLLLHVFPNAPAALHAPPARGDDGRDAAARMAGAAADAGHSNRQAHQPGQGGFGGVRRAPPVCARRRPAHARLAGDGAQRPQRGASIHRGNQPAHHPGRGCQRLDGVHRRPRRQAQGQAPVEARPTPNTSPPRWPICSSNKAMPPA